jgi:hypothetical protein
MDWDDGITEPGITNLVLNPQFRLDSNADGLCDNWNKVGNPATSTSMSSKVIGIRSQKVVTASSGTEGIETATITTVSGVRYTASAYIRVPSGGDRVTLELRNHAGSVVLASATYPSDEAGKWVRIECTALATSTSTRVRIVRNGADASVATTYYVSAVQLEITTESRNAEFSNKATTYCDGDQPRCRWNGVPHASTSVRDGTYKVAMTNISATEVTRPSTMERVRGRKPEHRIVFTLAEVT